MGLILGLLQGAAVGYEYAWLAMVTQLIALSSSCTSAPSYHQMK
jgi:hypothetical protein